MATQEGSQNRPGSTPNPDPTVRTVDQLQREIAASRSILDERITANRDKIHDSREVIETRLNAMDKAIELLQVSTDKLPSFIKDEVSQLRELHDEKFQSVEDRTTIQFVGIATQFNERDKRTEQLSLADKTAIAAALQAQKEAAGAQNESNSAANTKMEMNFSKLIDQGQTLLQAVVRNTDEKINDLKSRLDRGEGKTSVSDPAMGEMLKQLSNVVSGLTTSRDNSAGQARGGEQVWAYLIAFGGVVIAAVTLLTKLH